MNGRINNGGVWHPSGWSRVFSGGDTLTIIPQNLVGYTTLRSQSQSIVLNYKPIHPKERGGLQQDDDATIVIGQALRVVVDGFYAWLVMEGDPAHLPNFRRIAATDASALSTPLKTS